MQYEKSYQKTTLIKAAITSTEKEQAKRIAKSKGMTFSGWLGMVVRDAMQKESREARL